MNHDEQAFESALADDRDQRSFEAWFKKEYGQMIEAGDGNVYARESRFYKWEQDAFMAGIEHERARSKVLVEALRAIDRHYPADTYPGDLSAAALRAYNGEAAEGEE